MQILVVDDEAPIRELLSFNLKKSGYEVEMAADGRTALQKAPEADLVLLDIMLPGTDGFALCRAARQQGDAPILFVTAREDEQDKLHGYGLGADDYAVKPFSLAVLYAKALAAPAASAGLEYRKYVDSGYPVTRPGTGDCHSGRQAHRPAAQGICFAAGADGAQKPRADSGRAA